MKADEAKRNDTELRQQYTDMIVREADQMELGLVHLAALNEIGGEPGINNDINQLINQLKAKMNPGQVERLRNLAHNQTFIGNCAALDTYLDH